MWTPGSRRCTGPRPFAAPARAVAVRRFAHSPLATRVLAQLSDIDPGACRADQALQILAVRQRESAALTQEARALRERLREASPARRGSLQEALALNLCLHTLLAEWPRIQRIHGPGRPSGEEPQPNAWRASRLLQESRDTVAGLLGSRDPGDRQVALGYAAVVPPELREEFLGRHWLPDALRTPFMRDYDGHGGFPGLSRPALLALRLWGHPEMTHYNAVRALEVARLLAPGAGLHRLLGDVMGMVGRAQAQLQAFAPARREGAFLKGMCRDINWPRLSLGEGFTINRPYSATSRPRASYAARPLGRDDHYDQELRLGGGPGGLPQGLCLAGFNCLQDCWEREVLLQPGQRFQLVARHLETRPSGRGDGSWVAVECWRAVRVADVPASAQGPAAGPGARAGPG